MNNNWNELKCPYFKFTVIRELAEYFYSNNFNEYQESNDGGVSFKREDGCFIEIDYEMESSPNYTPTAIIGIGDIFDDKGNPSSVPFWFIIPENSSSRKYSKWKFSSESQLKAVLTQIKNELFKKHAVPLWTDLSLLKDKIIKFTNQINSDE